MSYINIIAQAPAVPAEQSAVTTQPAQTPAAGGDQPAQPEGSLFGTLTTFLLIGVIFYFLLIRPQKKQQKELKERQDGLKTGDKVVTAGGIFGIVREVKEAAVMLEIAPNTVIKIAKTSIVQTVAKDGSAS